MRMEEKNSAWESKKKRVREAMMEHMRPILLERTEPNLGAPSWVLVGCSNFGLSITMQNRNLAPMD